MAYTWKFEMKPQFILLCAVYLAFTAVETQNWNYNNSHDWWRTFPQCAGQRQSPINVVSRNVQRITNAPISFINFGRLYRPPMRIRNDGHTAIISIGQTIRNRRPRVLVSGVLYEVESLHWHWPAEHTINDRRYSAEAHFVTRNLRYNTITEALRHADGLLVLAMLVASTRRNTLLARNHLDSLLLKLPAISRYSSDTALDKNFTLAGLLGSLDTKQYFSYTGSLTTPPCSESVKFIIFRDVKVAATNKVQNFLKLQDRQGVPLRNTARPLQPLRGRTVHCQLCR